MIVSKCNNLRRILMHIQVIYFGINDARREYFLSGETENQLLILASLRAGQIVKTMDEK